MDQIREVVADKRSNKHQRNEAADAFTFTYEEEADPETFFVPYIWEVIVCVATSSVLEWSKPNILVFPLLEDPHHFSEEHYPTDLPLDHVDSSAVPSSNSSNPVAQFSQDVSDLV